MIDELRLEHEALKNKIIETLDDFNDDEFVLERLGVEVGKVPTYTYEKLKNLNKQIIMMLL